MMNQLTAQAPHMKQPQPPKAAERPAPREKDDANEARKADDASTEKVDETSAVGDGDTQEASSGFDGLLDAMLLEAPILQAQTNLPVVDAPPLTTPLPGEGELLATAEALLNLNTVDDGAAAQLNTQNLAASNAVNPADVVAETASVKANNNQAGVDAATLAAAKQAQAQSGQTGDAQSGFQLDPAKVDGDLVFNDRAGLIKAGDTRGTTVPIASSLSNLQEQVTGAPKLASVDALVQAATAAANGEAALDDFIQSNSNVAANTVETGSATQAAKAASDPAIAHRAVNTAGMEIARAAIAGRSRFDIRLDPAELGRIEVRIVMEKEKLQAKLTVEKPESLDLMLRVRQQLEKLLAAAGIELGENGIDMQLKDDGQNTENAFADLMGHGQDGKSDFFDIEGGDATPAGQAEADQLIAMTQMQMARMIDNPHTLNWTA